LVNAGAVALTWRLARVWPGGGRRAALISTLLLVANPWSVAFSRKIWQVAFVPILVLALVAALSSALVAGRRFRLAWALGLYGVLVQVHPSAVTLAPALLLCLVLFWRQVRTRELLVGGALAGLSAAPFLLHQASHGGFWNPVGWPAIAALRALPGATWDLVAPRLAWEAVTGRSIHALAGEAYPLLELVPQLGWTFNAVGWLAVAAATGLGWRAWREWRSPDKERRARAGVDAILLLCTLTPVAFNLRHSLELHLHFFILIVPPALLLIGRAAEGIAAKLRPRHPAWGLGVGAVSLLVAAQMAALILMGRFVARHDTPGGFGRPLGHYLELAEAAVAARDRDRTTEIVVVSEGDSVVVNEVPAIFDVLLRGRAPYRFVDGDETALFPAQRATVLLSGESPAARAWYQPWPRRSVGGGYELVTLDGTWPESMGLAPIGGNRTLENGVELQAFSLVEERSASEPVLFRLLWQVLWLDGRDTHLFVHMLDGDGQQVAQSDSAGLAVAFRQKGDRVISEVYITPGTERRNWSQARLGMYELPGAGPDARPFVNMQVIDGAGLPAGESVVVDLEAGGP
jgi:hypothetical protein